MGLGSENKGQKYLFLPLKGSASLFLIIDSLTSSPSTAVVGLEWQPDILLEHCVDLLCFLYGILWVDSIGCKTIDLLSLKQDQGGNYFDAILAEAENTYRANVVTSRLAIVSWILVTLITIQQLFFKLDASLWWFLSSSELPQRNARDWIIFHCIPSSDE